MKSNRKKIYLVTTYSVRVSWPSMWNPLANPKSQTAKSQLALTKIFEGFKSRCSTFALCTYFNDRNI